ncbi:type II toxin-antitoxin system RelE family toxin [Dryocola clanedunensis]|uniref:type II toxin-antitoxin system RelE family toxin n=1 Tax=Cedecea sulfonylureivorans TaxID=3051154 RepID=UPI0019275DFB|nr:type II toxin-antitoxin system RelE/ParE family toxin [Cedecea sulfonylureivorans]
MKYGVIWSPIALKTFKKLDASIRGQFLDKLDALRDAPRVEANALRGKLAGCYKIKLRSAGFRLVYEVDDGEILILVVGVGKRERDAAYIQAEKTRQKAGK